MDADGVDLNKSLLVSERERGFQIEMVDREPEPEPNPVLISTKSKKYCLETTPYCQNEMSLCDVWVRH